MNCLERLIEIAEEKRQEVKKEEKDSFSFKRVIPSVLKEILENNTDEELIRKRLEYLYLTGFITGRDKEKAKYK